MCLSRLLVGTCILTIVKLNINMFRPIQLYVGYTAFFVYFIFKVCHTLVAWPNNEKTKDWNEY